MNCASPPVNIRSECGGERTIGAVKTVNTAGLLVTAPTTLVTTTA